MFQTNTIIRGSGLRELIPLNMYELQKNLIYISIKITSWWVNADIRIEIEVDL
jgi:hypothetical protein